MKIETTAREDYLKAILVLEKKMGTVRSVDVAQYMGFSKPSVSRAVSHLTEGGFLYMDEGYTLHFTETGREIAEKTYERHCFFARLLMDLGVDPQTAGEDACRMEHAISDLSFQKLKEWKEWKEWKDKMGPGLRDRRAGPTDTEQDPGKDVFF